MWQGALANGMTRFAAAQRVLNSPEAQTLALTSGYRALLNRDADTEGLSYWLARSASAGGMTPWAFAVELATSAEYAVILADGGATGDDSSDSGGGLLGFSALRKKRNYNRNSLLACAIPTEQAPCDPIPIANEDDCVCGPCGGEKVRTPTAVDGFRSAGIMISPAGIHYSDGGVCLSSDDLGSSGFGEGWGHTRLYYSYAPTTGVNGNGWGVRQMPTIHQNGTSVFVVTNGINYRTFDPTTGNDYAPHHFLQDKLHHNNGQKEFTFTDAKGDEIRFHDFDSSFPDNKKGSLKSWTDPKGNVTAVTSYTTNGDIGEIQRSETVSGTTTTESYSYSYNNDNFITSVTLRRKVGSGSWSTVRQVAYSYYAASESHGNENDLKTAIIKDASNNTLDTKYYRYYTGEDGGNIGDIKYVFEADAFARLAAAYSNPYTATDSQAAPYAEKAYEFAESGKVSEVTLQGAGCSSCTGGQGTFSYSYGGSTVSSSPGGYNAWAYKAVETRPDGNTQTTYSNEFGEPILTVFTDVTTEDEWITFYKYDDAGRQILMAHPSAVSGYDESYYDLVHEDMGNYEFLRDSEGLIETTSWYTSTTANASTAGGVLGYQYQTHVKRGETGTAILQSTTEYYQKTASGITVNPVATTTRYRNTDGTGGQTTSYSYTYFSGTTQIESVTTTLPVVTTAQNGPNSADVATTYFDGNGRPIWHKDGDGFLHSTAYDFTTGAVTKSITDVDTTQTSDFANLPSGWSTLSGGGLHLKTLHEVDSLGRTTKTTDPNGNVAYTVYNDTNYEVRVYPGWNTSTNAPTGPTQVSRYDRPGSYSESLTMSATPSLDSNNRPTGAESIGSLQTLSRTVTNTSSQTTSSDAYFNLTGVTYSTSVTLGTEGTNYYRTRYGYDHLGRQDRVQTPTNTITRTFYDSLSRTQSTWIGLDDTPTTGEWSPSNTSGTDLVKVSESVYDGDGVGDSNLTQTTAFPGGSAADRVSQTFYDWRNRAVVSKGGVQTTESTDTQRPITYVELDNLSQSIASEYYDGDNVSISDGNSDGVPDKPSSSLRRARSEASYDEQGRVYQSKTFSVDQSSGSTST